MSYIYLASPYSHPEEVIRIMRFNHVCICAGHLMKQGHHIFSPIAHTHPIALMGDLPTHFDYWAEYDIVMLDHAKELWVLQLKGWDESHGVANEIKIAINLKIPIKYINEATYEVTDNAS